MRAFIPLCLFALIPVGECIAERPQASTSATQLEDAAICSAAVQKLKTYVDPASKEPNGLGIAESVAGMHLTMVGADAKQQELALQAASVTVETMVAGRTREQAKDLLEAKLSECLKFANNTDVSGGSRNV